MMTRRNFLLAATTLPAIGCAKQADEPTIYTGSVLTLGSMTTRVGLASFGKQTYAEVNRDWLLWCYLDFRKWIAEGQFGVLSWEDRAQCTFFATAFEVYCQKKYFAHAYHSSVPAPGIAVGSIWYPVTALLGHAVSLTITSRGRELFEPQTGKFFTLPEEQYQRAYFRKFD